MQYVSAVALANLSGKAPSNTRNIQTRIRSSPSLRPLASPSMRLRSMLSSPPSMAGPLMTYFLPHPGHHKGIVQGLPQCRTCCSHQGR